MNQEHRTMSKPTLGGTYDLGKIVERAKDNQLDLTYEGEVVLSIPAPELWPDESMAAAAAGDVRTALRTLVGEKQLEAFKKRTGLTSQTVLAAIDDHYGLTVGESSASSK
jgi:hypothetical protein